MGEKLPFTSFTVLVFSQSELLPADMSNLTIADTGTPDPWMLSHDSHFYLTFTAATHIEIWRSLNMENFRSCHKTIAWRPGTSGGKPWFVDLWAPELHRLRGRWYIYFTGAPPRDENRGTYNSHRRTLLLRCRSQDPMEEGSWEFLGQLQGLPDHWNIDATVFSLPSSINSGATPGEDRLYCCYSGWPTGDFSDTQQDLFLIELSSPETALPLTLTCISRAELPWERTEDDVHGVNEGATFISLPDTTSPTTPLFQGIIYSANGSWTSKYRLGVLELIRPSHPLEASSWRKRPNPLLVSDKAHGGPHGPGHASFIPSSKGDGSVYCIYHATEFQDQGWANRKARVLCFDKRHFLEGAETCCCALKVSGSWSGGAAVS